jgi:hypothetical protein
MMNAFEKVIIEALREAASYSRVQARKEAYQQARKSIECGDVVIQVVAKKGVDVKESVK